MSTPCCGAVIGEVSKKAWVRGDGTRVWREERAHRVEYAAQGLQLLFEIRLFPLQLVKCPLHGSAVGDGSRGGPRGDGGCVEVAHVVQRQPHSSD